MKIKDITYREFYEKTAQEREDYLFALKYGKFEQIDLFGFGDFLEQTFGFVKDFQYALNRKGLDFTSLLELLETYTDKTIKDLANMSIFDMHKTRLYIRDQVGIINNIERVALSHEPSAKEQAAGLDMFASYDSFLQYDKLAGGDVCKVEKVKKLPYMLCFTKLKLEKDKSVYEMNLNKLYAK